MASLTMPNVGESVTEGTVTRWLKREGDRVERDEPVVEIETEKVEVEVPSPFEGTLIRILVAEGEVAPIGAPLAEFQVAGAAGAPREVVTPPAAAAAATTGNRQQAAEAPDTPGGATAAVVRRARRYSPVVLKLAAEHDIDLELVQGSGIEGRVTRQDVMGYLENPVAHTVPPPSGSGVVGVSQREDAARPQRAPASSPPPAAAATLAAATDDDEIVRLSPTRRTIAARMLEAHRTMPPAWMVVEADVTGLVRLREAHRAEFEQREGVPLTYLPFFVQAIVSALEEHPEVNATYADDGIRLHRHIHAGIAVAAASGLIVPVIRDAGRKSIAGLAHAIDELGAKARDRKLSIDDVRGATITIDNTGAFGSIISQPIIPPGQAAIVTTEAIRRELRVRDDGSFAARSVMNLCVSFDHRALDGAQVGTFMRAVRQRLESVRDDHVIY